jgi:1-acyl-sn-glycerol-3-phosphate acyltransferase
MLPAEGIVAFSVVAIVLLALVVAAVVWHFLRRYRLSLAEAGLYFLNVLLARILWGTRVDGTIDLQPGQGAIFVCNHRSSIDPLFLQMLIPRAIHFLVAKEYVGAPLIGWPLRVSGAIPVNRGAIDTAATKMAIRSAQSGEMIGIFPEGRINRTDEFMLPGRPGVALIALKARAPVIPCYIDGAPYQGNVFSPFYTPARVRVRIGDAIDLSEYYAREDEEGILAEITRRLMKEISRLAGIDDFEPQIAGRRGRAPEEDAELSTA